MQKDQFPIANFDGKRYWLTREGDDLVFCRQLDSDENHEVLARLSRETKRSLLTWLSSETLVTAGFEGPMAVRIKEASESLKLPEQAIIWNAVKLFLDIGDHD